MPPIAPPGVPVSWASPGPNMLSSATKSISGSVGDVTFGPIPFGRSGSNCFGGNGAPLRCTVTVPARAGNHQLLTLRTFAGPSITKQTLANAASFVDLFPGKNHVVAQPIAIADRIAVSSSQKVVMQGQWSPLALTLYAIDASGTAVPSIYAKSKVDGKLIVDASLSVSGFVTNQYSYLKCCGTQAQIVYNGIKDVPETITASVNGYPPARTMVQTSPGPTAEAPILVTNSWGNYAYLAEYAAGATGNAAPVRSIVPHFPIFGENATGGFWGGSIARANWGGGLGEVILPNGFTPSAIDGSGNLYALNAQEYGPCLIEEFPGGRFGVLQPVRRIDCSRYLRGQINPDSIYADAAGNVYLSLESLGYYPVNEILEYSATSGSGKIAASRTIAFSGYGFPSIAGSDNAGNFYALFDGNLYEYAPGSTAGTQLLNGVIASSAAVDGAGDIFIGINSPPTVEKFAAGSSTAAWTISGSSTQLANPQVIPPP
ncbi:MAG: hypothetical protein JO277_04405 [Candidatus Eremiobacteraeota bacterium]|nr:hypothetical protein [Candidatus Eremiobacteraeota bacterium]